MRMGAFAALLALLLVEICPGQLIYQEGFNDDGDGTRYTLEGRGFEITDTGPGMWEHNFNAEQIGLVSSAPARRAGILFDHDTFFTDWEPEVQDLWSNLATWMLDGKENAQIGFFPSILPESSLEIAMWMEDLGHSVIEIPTAENLPAPDQLDLLIHTSEGNPEPPTAFADYAVPGIFFNAANHDDTLTAQIGQTFDFLDGISLNVVEENANHPVLEGLPNPVPWTNFGTTGLQGMGNPAPGAEVLLTFTDPDTGAERPALIVIEEGGALLGAFAPQPEGEGFIVGADMDAGFGGGATAEEPRVLQLNPVDISGQADVTLSVALAATDADFDGPDVLRVLVGQSGDFPEDFIVLSEFLPVDDPNSPFNKGLSDDGGETGLSSAAFTDVTWNISELAPDITDLVVRFEAFSTFPNEIVGIDNVRIFAGEIGPGGIAGDFNNNGLVEQEDLDLVLANWGDPADAAPPTWTNDPPEGNIDQTELDKVLVNWGNTSALGGSAAVPEPGTLVLLLAAVAVAAAARRRVG